MDDNDENQTSNPSSGQISTSLLVADLNEDFQCEKPNTAGFSVRDASQESNEETTFTFSSVDSAENDESLLFHSCHSLNDSAIFSESPQNKTENFSSE